MGNTTMICVMAIGVCPEICGKELCMKLMEIFDLTMKTACDYTMWLIHTLPVYLPDRKHIRRIAN